MNSKIFPTISSDHFREFGKYFRFVEEEGLLKKNFRKGPPDSWLGDDGEVFAGFFLGHELGLKLALEPAGRHGDGGNSKILDYLITHHDIMVEVKTTQVRDILTWTRKEEGDSCSPVYSVNYDKEIGRTVRRCIDQFSEEATNLAVIVLVNKKKFSGEAGLYIDVAPIEPDEVLKALSAERIIEIHIDLCGGIDLNGSGAPNYREVWRPSGMLSPDATLFNSESTRVSGVLVISEGDSFLIHNTEALPRKLPYDIWGKVRQLQVIGQEDNGD